MSRVQKLHLLTSRMQYEMVRVRAPRLRASSVMMVFLLVTLALVPAFADPAPELDVHGMTFVASRENNDAVILRADHARFDTEAKKAYLKVVDASVPASVEQRGFSMRCDESVVDLDTNDFEATGNVNGETGGGEHFEAEWVRYDHAAGVLFTEGRVVITDRGTKVIGGGFRYDIAKRRFQLLGGAKVVRDAKAGLGH